MILTFMPGSFSNSGLQYTGTGTGTEDLPLCAAEPLAAVGGVNLAGKLQPYACIRPSSFLT